MVGLTPLGSVVRPLTKQQPLSLQTNPSCEPTKHGCVCACGGHVCRRQFSILPRSVAGGGYPSPAHVASEKKVMSVRVCQDYLFWPCIPQSHPSGKGTQEKGVPAMQISPPRCRAVVGRQLFSDTPAAGSPVLGVHSTTLGPAKIILEGSGGQQEMNCVIDADGTRVRVLMSGIGLCPSPGRTYVHTYGSVPSPSAGRMASVIPCVVYEAGFDWSHASDDGSLWVPRTAVWLCHGASGRR